MSVLSDVGSDMNHQVLCLFTRVHRKYSQKVTDGPSILEKIFESGLAFVTWIASETL